MGLDGDAGGTSWSRGFFGRRLEAPPTCRRSVRFLPAEPPPFHHPRGRRPVVGGGRGARPTVTAAV